MKTGCISGNYKGWRYYVQDGWVSACKDGVNISGVRGLNDFKYIIDNRKPLLPLFLK
jgi:hypothetical protein